MISKLKANKFMSKFFQTNFIFLLFLIPNLQAQDITIKGKVIYKEDKMPVPYAYVQVLGKNVGTVTDYEGQFSLKIPDELRNAQVTFSYVGLKKKVYHISNIQNPENMLVALETDVTALEEVVVNKTKELKPKKILKKAIRKITDNYAQEAVLLDAYYRDVLREKGKAIQYADGVGKVYYNEYEGKVYKWKDYFKARTKAKIQVDPNRYLSFGWWGERLHDHFSTKGGNMTLATDKVEIIDSRSSDNLTTENIEAYIEGSFLKIASKDVVRYLDRFMNKKEFKHYKYTISEEIDEDGSWYYLIQFNPEKKPATDEELKTKIKKKRTTSRRHILSGKIAIDAETYAFKRIQYFVAPAYKKHICNFTTMAIKHFGYDVDIQYQKIKDTWHLQKIKKIDEFIFVDTVKNQTNPYQAVSELYIQKVETEKVTPLEDKENVYDSYNINPLFEEPLDYKPDFWKKYESQNPIAIVPDSIRKDLEVKKKLEKQFKDKHIRNDSLPAPVANIDPYTYTIHREKVVDDYAWLKDTTQPKYNEKVMEYLKAENDYSKNYFIPLRKAQRTLYKTMLAKVKKNVKSLPFFDNGYYYITEYKEDKQYPFIYRTKDTTNKELELLFDVNEMAKDKPYFALAGYVVSPNNKLIAYGANTDGSDRYKLYIQNLETKEILDSLENLANLMWDNDNKSFYYTVQDKRTLRSYKVMKHQIGKARSEDTFVYEEKDETFSVSIGRSKKGKYFFITTGNSISSETLFKRGYIPSDTFKIIHPRELDHIYSVTVYKDTFYIFTDKNAPNFKLMRTTPEKYEMKYWEEIIPTQKEVRLEGVSRFKNYMVISERQNAEERIKVIDLKTDKSHYIKFPEEVYSCWVGSNPKKDTDILRIGYTSFNTPTKIYDYNMQTRKKKLVRNQKVLGYFNSKTYKTKRLWATAKDGTKIPISLVYHKYRFNKEGNNRVWLTGYGSYGIPESVGFSSSIISLLDAGYIYAIAHVRGGGDGGRQWHKEGKMFKKRNTFTDFIACAEYLIAEKYTKPKKIVTYGGSAGGLLMGAISNMRPDLFHTVVLEVPFVDVVNTMLDDKLPLTTGEYLEWGNPNIKKCYKYMKSYSPYDNVSAQEYPNMLFFTGINDTRVGYWEPAKMVAKLRKMNTGDNKILLKTNFNTGHGGGSERFSGLKEFAYKIVLINDLFKETKEQE